MALESKELGKADMLLRTTSSVHKNSPSPTQEDKICQESGLSKHVTHDRALR